MKLIVGLGNPGPRYDKTRHNFGFAVVDAVARRWAIDLSREKFHAFFGDGTVHDQAVYLLKPTTFMNRSGGSVLAAGRFYRAEREDLLVITDDMALPLGQIRLRTKGSAGSHNGLADIIDRIGFTDFTRLRLGIDPPIGDPADYVLSRFTAEEEPIVEQVITTAADAVQCWIEHGPIAAMDQYNRKVDQD